MISSGKFWLGIGLSAILLALFFATIDVGDMASSLADANYLFLVPAVLAYLVSVLFRTMRWRVLLRHMKPISTRRLYPVVTIGYMANDILPFRLGEVVRSYYVGEREGISKSSALTSVFIERVLDAMTLLFFMAVIALFVPLSGLADALGDKVGKAGAFLMVLFSAPFILAFGTLLLSAAFPSTARLVAMKVVRPLPERFEAPIRNLIDYFLHGLVPLRSPRIIIKLFLISIPVWLLEALVFLLIAFSFNLHNAFPDMGQMVIGIILITAIANIGSTFIPTPGGIGAFELITTESLQFLLPMTTVAAGFATLVHATLLLPMIVLGQVFLWTGHISLQKLARAGQASEVVAQSSSGPDTDDAELTPTGATEEGERS